MRRAAAERQGKVHTMMYTRQDVIVIAPVQVEEGREGKGCREGGIEGGRGGEREIERERERERTRDKMHGNILHEMDNATI